MRVAIIHYWLVGMRGGERVLESLCRLYPQADIFTHCVRPESLSDTLRSHRIFTTFLGKLPGVTRYYKHCLPLMPLALEQLDLRGYDLILSNESGPAKGIIVRSDVPHLCYCFTPMRYLWDFTHDYMDAASPITRFLMRLFFHSLRQWDLASAARPDRIVAISDAVARRVHRCWRREASIVHPPVELQRFTPADPADIDEYYLYVGELVEYKRVDLAVAAATRSGRKLIVAGDGTELVRLKKMAGPSVTFLGRVSDTDVVRLLARCRALVFPGEEDFGIVPLEAAASGRPVIAYGRGGALETVVDGITGLLFDAQTPESLLDALDRFEQKDAAQPFDAAALVAHAQRFGEARFHREFAAEVELACAQVHTAASLRTPSKLL